jgi:hypothetical protein
MMLTADPVRNDIASNLPVRLNGGYALPVDGFNLPSQCVFASVIVLNRNTQGYREPELGHGGGVSYPSELGVNVLEDMKLRPVD